MKGKCKNYWPSAVSIFSLRPHASEKPLRKKPQEGLGPTSYGVPCPFWDPGSEGRGPRTEGQGKEEEEEEAEEAEEAEAEAEMLKVKKPTHA